MDIWHLLSELPNHPIDGETLKVSVCFRATNSGTALLHQSICLLCKALRCHALKLLHSVFQTLYSLSELSVQHVPSPAVLQVVSIRCGLYCPRVL